MAGAHFPAGHVVQVVDALDIERNVLVAFDEGQVAARIRNLREIDELDGVIERLRGFGVHVVSHFL
ncbi:hypothetical protein D9M71_755270 [compost metagenome]